MGTLHHELDEAYLAIVMLDPSERSLCRGGGVHSHRVTVNRTHSLGLVLFIHTF